MTISSLAVDSTAVCLALFLRTVSNRVLLVEKQSALMERASRVNQARIHTGFHYPRSALTAVKSMVLHRRFMADFPDAVVNNFQMLYAISRRRSKISSNRFLRMFQEIGAPIQPATAIQQALFDPRTIEGVFACSEPAFDYSVLRSRLSQQLLHSGVVVSLSTDIAALNEQQERVVAFLSSGLEVTARYAFNVTYSKINSILSLSGLPPAHLKHELAEIALVKPPPELERFGVTVMDGPFFSMMPYPSEALHSLTHVRYTPHRSWTDVHSDNVPKQTINREQIDSHVRHMILDGQRYLPALKYAEHQRSLYEVKTVLQKNEQDDGRPILYQRRPIESRVISILGAKIDNIYDLFELVKTMGAEFEQASDRLIVLGRS